MCFHGNMKVSDLHGVANGIQNLGMTTFGGSFVPLHARLQRVKAGLQFANLSRQGVLLPLPNILHHAHGYDFTYA